MVRVPRITPHAEQRTSPLDVLKAFTINGAYSEFEENMSGSIEKGKQADMAVLSANPLTFDSSKIQDLKWK